MILQLTLFCQVHVTLIWTRRCKQTWDQGPAVRVTVHIPTLPASLWTDPVPKSLRDPALAVLWLELVCGPREVSGCGGWIRKSVGAVGL